MIIIIIIIIIIQTLLLVSFLLSTAICYVSAVTIDTDDDY